MTIKMRNEEFGKEITVPTGFSWTSLFFAIFVPIFRGNLKQTLIWGLAAIFTGGLAMLAMPFFLNKLHIKDMIAKGYVPVAAEDSQQLKQMEISVKNAA